MNTLRIISFGLLLGLMSCSTPQSNSPFSISSGQLTTLDFETFKKFGFNDKGDYLMRIEHEGHFVYLGVKTFELNGRPVLTPIFTDKEHRDNLYVLVLESPIFADYKQFQINRARERTQLN